MYAVRMPRSKPNTKDITRTLTIRIPDSLRVALAADAARDGRPLASYVRRVLAAHVAPLPIVEGRRLVAGQAVPINWPRRKVGAK